MKPFWRWAAIIPCLGFTALMAGANLARITAQSEATTITLFSASIPMATIWAVTAISIDAVIILSPFAIGYCYRHREHIVLLIALVLWGFCSVVSVQNVHDLLHEKMAKNAEPTLKEAKKYEQAQENLKQEKSALKELEQKLLAEEDYGRRKNLKEAEKGKKSDIEKLEATIASAPVFHVERIDESKVWLIAVGLWALSVGSWVVFMKEGGASKNPLTKQGRVKGSNVVELRPKMAEQAAIEKAWEMRDRTPPASWEEIALATGWPLSSIHKKAAGRRHGSKRGF